MSCAVEARSARRPGSTQPQHGLRGRRLAAARTRRRARAARRAPSVNETPSTARTTCLRLARHRADEAARDRVAGRRGPRPRAAAVRRRSRRDLRRDVVQVACGRRRGRRRRSRSDGPLLVLARASNARSHRGCERAARRAARSSRGGEPGIETSTPFAVQVGRRREEQPRVRVPWDRGRARRRPCSTISPAYMTAARSQSCATTGRSCVTSSSASPKSRQSASSSSRICACTITSSAVVGSSATSTLGSQASAMAIAARWRMPPENSCGKRAPRSARDPDRLEQLAARAARLPRPVARPCNSSASTICELDRLHRVERVHRALEDDREVDPAVRPDRAPRRRRGCPPRSAGTRAGNATPSSGSRPSEREDASSSCRSPTRPTRPRRSPRLERRS